MRQTNILIATAICVSVMACGSSGPAAGAVTASSAGPAAASGDQAFRAIAREAIEDFLRRHPSAATDLGVHTYDRQFEDLSAAAIAAESKTLADFRTRVSGTDPAALSLDAQLDREQLLRAFDATLLGNDVIRQWAKNPDV